jgi:hypothetical protein
MGHLQTKLMAYQASIIRSLAPSSTDPPASEVPREAMCQALPFAATVFDTKS